MFFYRELPPSNVPPNSANLKIWMNGKNIDGSNNSTLTADQELTTISNLGTAGGNWTIAQDAFGYRPFYEASPQSLKIGHPSRYVTRVGGHPEYNCASATISGGANGGKASGFIVFSYYGAKEYTGAEFGGGRLFQGSNGGNCFLHQESGGNDVLRIQINNSNALELNTGRSFTTGSNADRYCLTWRYNPTISGGPGILLGRLNGVESSVTPFQSPDPWTWQTHIGAHFDFVSANVNVESFGVYEGNDVELSAIETWVSNYYGTLG